MGKIISVFCHKGGVGKTTFVHNVAFELASKGKSVLLIDADPQMNLTSAIHGFSDDLQYSSDSATWFDILQKYSSLHDLLKEAGVIVPQILNGIDELDAIKAKTPFVSRQAPLIKLISASLNIVEGEYKLSSIKNEPTQAPYKLQKKLDEYAGQYDFVIIDTPPSAASMLNGVLVLASHYLICPVLPTFFSLQAVDNHSNIITNWSSALTPCDQYGFVRRVKSLGLVMQMAKRFKTKGEAPLDENFSKHTASWTRKINTSIENVHRKISDSGYSISKSDFQDLLPERDPFILEMFCDFTAKLKGFADDEGVPITQLDKVDDNKKLTAALNLPQYKNSLANAKESYNSIANSLISISQKI